jgi:poly(A) polymerase
MTTPEAPLAPDSPSVTKRRQRRRTRRNNGNRSRDNSPSSSSSSLAAWLPADERLEESLRSMGYYDAEEDANRRVALDYLETILAQWASTFRTLENTNTTATWASRAAAAAANTTNGTGTRNAASSTATNPLQLSRVVLITFGSFRLGVHRPNSDLDVIALTSPNCTRGDFFATLVKLLQQDPKVSRVHPIPQAYTPVIKFVLNSYHVDLLFARAANPQKLLAHQQQTLTLATPVPTAISTPSQPPRSEYMIDDTDLLEQDAAGVRSLNGARVTQVLLEMVPHLENYRVVLRAVKEWAVTHGIYSNVLGFLGGVNWAVLVAWVCIRHPAPGPARLLELFFRTFCVWKWPAPVLLGPIQETPPAGALRLPSWNPNTNPRDGLDVMPIITPSYPSMNSSYNVGIPQLRRIQDEMIRACNSLRLSPSSNQDYRVLFRQSDFFRQHKHFLHLTIRATNAQDFVEWFRFCESRLRVLITDLESRDVNVWPFGRFFDRSYSPTGLATGAGKSLQPDCLQESCFFIALRFAPQINQVNLRYLTHNYLHTVNSWNERSPGMDLSIAHVTAEKLPEYCWQADQGNANHDGAEDWSLPCQEEEQQGRQQQQPVPVAPPAPVGENQTNAFLQSGGSFDLASPTKRSRRNDTTP